jgi:hypothetical protein
MSPPPGAGRLSRGDDIADGGEGRARGAQREAAEGRRACVCQSQSSMCRARRVRRGSSGLRVGVAGGEGVGAGVGLVLLGWRLGWRCA